RERQHSGSSELVSPSGDSHLAPAKSRHTSCGHSTRYLFLLVFVGCAPRTTAPGQRIGAQAHPTNCSFRWPFRYGGFSSPFLLLSFAVTCCTVRLRTLGRRQQKEVSRTG